MVMVEQSEADRRRRRRRVRLRVATRVTAGQNIMRRAASLARGDRRAGSRARHAADRDRRAGRSRARAGARRAAADSWPCCRPATNWSDRASVPRPDRFATSNGPMLRGRRSARRRRRPSIWASPATSRSNLRERIAAGLEADVLVLSGGVSAGVLDLVPGVLAELGVRASVSQDAAQAGQAAVVWRAASAARPTTLVFGLPGNPVSSLVCFELFVRPALARLAGRPALGSPETAARLCRGLRASRRRPTYHPARTTFSAGVRTVEPLKWRGSADLATLTAANALIAFPPGERQHRAGEVVHILKWDA